MFAWRKPHETEWISAFTIVAIAAGEMIEPAGNYVPLTKESAKLLCKLYK